MVHFESFYFIYVVLCLFFCPFSGFEAYIYIYIYIILVCNFMFSNQIIWKIIHGESKDIDFFYQSSTRYLSSERCSDFPHLASHVET